MIMETINGTSPTIQVESGYIDDGGIAVFSTTDDTVTGGSIKNPDGSYFDAYQILWTITRVPSGDGYTYTGGITGDYGWYFEEPSSPFYGYTIGDVAAEAFPPGPGNLNRFFTEWLVDTSSDEKYTFLHEKMRNARACLHYSGS